MSELSPNTLELLRHVSVATLCTQLFKRGFRNVFIQGIARLTDPSGGNLVGPAFTTRNIPAREDLDQISAFDNPEHPQRKGIESVPPGHVLVIDCRGETRVASGGQILTTRLKVRGAAEQEKMEAFILERVENGAALPGTYPPNAQTRAAFESWRKEKGI